MWLCHLALTNLDYTFESSLQECFDWGQRFLHHKICFVLNIQGNPAQKITCSSQFNWYYSGILWWHISTTRVKVNFMNVLFDLSLSKISFVKYPSKVCTKKLLAVANLTIHTLASGDDRLCHWNCWLFYFCNFRHFDFGLLEFSWLRRCSFSLIPTPNLPLNKKVL